MHDRGEEQEPRFQWKRLEPAGSMHVASGLMARLEQQGPDPAVATIGFGELLVSLACGALGLVDGTMKERRLGLLLGSGSSCSGSCRYSRSPWKCLFWARAGRDPRRRRVRVL